MKTTVMLEKWQDGRQKQETPQRLVGQLALHIQPRTTKDSASNKMETLKTVSFDLHVHTDHTVVRRVVRTAKV